MAKVENITKDVLIIIFRAFPKEFVLVGGGALHWIFNSPRLSVDLDLKPLRHNNQLIKDIANTLIEKLPALAVHWGVKSIDVELTEAKQTIRILIDDRPALHLELAPLAPVTGRENHLLQSDTLQSEIIVTPDIHQLLFAKAAALVKRTHVKGRDVFDIWFLQSRGALLDPPTFVEYLKWEEKDENDLQKVLDQITADRLKSDLGRFLPESIQNTLAQDQYKTLIEAVQKLFAPFL